MGASLASHIPARHGADQLDTCGRSTCLLARADVTAMPLRLLCPFLLIKTVLESFLSNRQSLLQVSQFVPTGRGPSPHFPESGWRQDQYTLSRSRRCGSYKDNGVKEVSFKNRF